MSFHKTVSAIVTAIFMVVTASVQHASALQEAPEFPFLEGVPFSIEVTFYEVEGRTQRVLTRNLQFHGPVGYDAETQYRISLVWQNSESSDECHFIFIEIPIEIIIKYPRWVDEEHANNHMREDWARRMHDLEAHENGHAKLALISATVLYNELMAVEPQTNCDSLDEQVHSLSETAFQRARDLQRDYDLETDHGQQQTAWSWEPYNGILDKAGP